MARYTILRKGSNAANQSMTLGWVPVDTQEAATADEALEKSQVDCYNNQVLRASVKFQLGYRRSKADGSYFER